MESETKQTREVNHMTSHVTSARLTTDKMVLSTGLTIGIVSAVWGFVGIVLPILVQCCMFKSPNKGIIQMCMILTAVCCYLFWISTYLCQLNPLIGPQLETSLIRMMQYEWARSS